MEDGRGKILTSLGFGLVKVEGVTKIEAYGKYFNKDTHPFSILGKLYREETNPDLKYLHLKAMHDMCWPQDICTWHYWTEERFRIYCEGWRIMSWASGASGGKSVDGAKLTLLDFWSAPKTTAAIIASTTLNALQARIYGYTLAYLRDSQVKMPYTLMRSQPPKILLNRDDEIHCISALAAAKGKDAESIKNYIGRHPKGKLILVIDEAPDIDSVILSALPNLEAGKENAFQCLVIGNSLSIHDLHGSLSTPKNGDWKSINPMKDTKWETTQDKGICLFFSCYNSPAIHETDPVKKAALGKFLVTAEQIEAKAKIYGAKSDSFNRFVLGFWRFEGTEDTVVSEVFVNEFNVSKLAEWSGFYNLQVMAGLDVAFAVGGDECYLQLGILGQDVRGKVLLDFRGEDLLFKIVIKASQDYPAEMQIADQVIQILNRYNCTLNNLAVDATGQGRAIASVIQLKAQSQYAPIKIWSSRTGANAVGGNKDPDVIVKAPLDLWFDMRDFIQTDQLRGINTEALRQLTSRLVVRATDKNGNLSSKQVLESKSSYKARMQASMPGLAHSPDKADALALCLQAAKIRFGFTPGQVRELPVQRNAFAYNKDMARMFMEKERGASCARSAPVATFSSDIDVDTQSFQWDSSKPV